MNKSICFSLLLAWILIERMEVDVLDTVPGEELLAWASPRLVGSRWVWGNTVKVNPLSCPALLCFHIQVLGRASRVWPRGGATQLAQRHPCLPSSCGSSGHCYGKVLAAGRVCLAPHDDSLVTRGTGGGRTHCRCEGWCLVAHGSLGAPEG